MLLCIVLLMASSSAWGRAAACDGINHVRLYMHETVGGPNSTVFATVMPLFGANTTFGMVGLLDDELRDGKDPSKSLLLGRFQGMVAYSGRVNPPGMQSVISFIFTAGKYNGSTLAMVGTVVSFQGEFERAIVGGTGAFRFARGYCGVKAVSTPTPVLTVYEVNLFVKMD